MASAESFIQGTGQPRSTTSTSTKQLNLASMSIDDADQSNKDTPVAVQLNMSILTQLRVDDNIQSPKQNVDEYSGQVDPITGNSIAQGATGYGLTSGFSDPVFVQTATPIQHSSFTSGIIPKFDTLALDKSHGQEISTSTSVFESTFGAPSGYCSQVFGQTSTSKKYSSSRSEGGSNENVRQNMLASPQVFSDATCHDNDIGQAGTTTSTSSHRTLSTRMSIDDADQLANNTVAAEPFNMTNLIHLTVNENSQTLKQREDHDSGFTSDNTPKFDTLASNPPSFGDLAQSGGTAFGNATSFAASPFGTSNTSIRAFGSKIRSDADRFTNNRTVDAPKKTISSNLTNDGNYQNLKQSGDESHGQEISTNITTIKQGMTNFESTFGTPEFSRSVLRNSAASKRDSSSSRSGGADGILSKENVRPNVFAFPQVFSDATSHGNALFGNQGAKSFRSTGSSQTASISGGKFSSESVGGVGYLGFGISQHQEQSTSDTFNMTVLRHLTEDENSQIPMQQADGYYEQVDTTTNTTTTQGANGLSSGFAQPVFGMSATTGQHASSSSIPGSETPFQASGLQSFGDLAQSSGSTFGSTSSYGTKTFGTLGSENPRGSGGSTFGSGPSFTGYRS